MSRKLRHAINERDGEDHGLTLDTTVTLCDGVVMTGKHLNGLSVRILARNEYRVSYNV